MKKLDFIPVILGTDANAYGMAKAFHQQYGINSVAVGRAPLFTTKNSSILSVIVCNDFIEPSVFVKKLIDIANELKSKSDNLILIASSDNYVELIVNHKKALEDYYILPFIDKELMLQLNSKESFYKICDQYKLDYPKTFIIEKNKKDDWQLPFEFPVVLKPSDSMLYFETSFPGKKKAYILQNERELRKVIDTIYQTKYDKNIIIQEYIPGDDTGMRVLNCYSGKDKKVKMMCLGRPLLEDCTPSLIGNYTAIVSEYNQQIYQQFKRFLEDIGYIGYSNFDMKYDPRDGKYKVFEINLRQGRSSYFVTGSGYNQAKYLVNDFIYNQPQELTLGSNEHLWLGIPYKLLLKYLVDESLKKYVRRLIDEKKYSYTLYYNKDFNLIRYLRVSKYYYQYYNRYKNLYEKKQ